MIGISKARTGAAIAAALAIAVTACDGSSQQNAPGAVSEGEAKALEDAADMLDEQRLPDGVLPVIETPPAGSRDSDPPAMSQDAPA
jgi:hypothetical protein